MGERNSPDAGDTTLAAATAAIITARWAGASTHPPHVAEPPAHSGNGNGSSGNGNGGNGHAAPGHGGGVGFTEVWAVPATG